MSAVLTFQEAVARLHAFWGKHGCLNWQPCNTEVGAGTMNPATFLRVLGPEPWNVGYVEPSVRPDDSRYGDNPNRVQMHHQYQLILKPDPGNPQELYLQSLETLGIDHAEHDLRFVEDNWESPALGAWGLGWEVWLDGLEITQYTYFQQAGGQILDPPSVEVTYGLERILMALQGVDHFKKLLYAPGLTFEEVLLDNEYQMSVYNLDAADVGRMQQLFEIYEAEARMLLERQLPLPAYSYVLKTSHVFNLLDARGAVGVTERARFFARMRNLARDVAEGWLNQRKERGFPLGVAPLPTLGASRRKDAEFDGPQTLVLEIGTEELPPADAESAIEQLRRLVPEMLAELRLTHGTVEVEGTPRRLVVRVVELSPRQPDEERVVRGPRVQTAFDAEGKPTKAAMGFARGQGVDASALQRRVIDGVEYVVALVHTAGRPTVAVLAEALPELLAKITFPKGMRWNRTGVSFSRPIRWLLALYGEAVVPFEYAGVASDRTTRGFRNAQPSNWPIPHADQHQRLLAEAGIVLAVAERKERIATACAKLAGEINGHVPESALTGLLDEVANLVEGPMLFRGAFEPAYLALPRDVLTTVMTKHQRYFPVEDSAGNLLPAFVAVANGRVNVDAVRKGNEAVLRARYADAEFFWKQDAARPLAEYRTGLGTLTFQAKLGSMLDKNERLVQLEKEFEEVFGLTPAERETARRAAYLAKADLATRMVMELTSLAGIMGREYAMRGGEPTCVAEAIFEHVLPRFAGDRLPESKPGVLLALVDRLDSLVGLFAAGLAPKGSADPFALRRAALGVVQTLLHHDLDLDLAAAIRVVARVQPIPVTEDVERQVLEFVRRRFEQMLLERGERHDLVAAVLSARGHRVALAQRTLRELTAAAPTEAFARFLTTYSRPARLVRDRVCPSEVKPALFETEQEKTLWAAVEKASPRVDPNSSLEQLQAAFEPLIEPIGAFFDKVFVMVENEAVRANRFALLRKIADLTIGIVDLTKVEGF
jgi:glycyl-tRNA synthetase